MAKVKYIRDIDNIEDVRAKAKELEIGGNVFTKQIERACRGFGHQTNCSAC